MTNIMYKCGNVADVQITIKSNTPKQNTVYVYQYSMWNMWNLKYVHLPTISNRVKMDTCDGEFIQQTFDILIKINYSLFTHVFTRK